MKPTLNSGYGSAIVYHEDTNDAYEIDCKWSYSYYPATLEQPEELEFNTFKHSLVSINGERTSAEIPDWINWEEYDEKIYYNEITNG